MTCHIGIDLLIAQAIAYLISGIVDWRDGRRG